MVDLVGRLFYPKAAANETKNGEETAFTAENNRQAHSLARYLVFITAIRRDQCFAAFFLGASSPSPSGRGLNEKRRENSRRN
jgi:hypothetical protein